MSFSHQTTTLSAGRHRRPADGVCVMELASILAEEPFSDHPRSVSPVLADVLRGGNDGLDPRRRQTLRPYAALSVGTASGRVAERRRRRLVREWGVEHDPGTGLLAALSRRVDAAWPYAFAVLVARRITERDDDDLHRRLLALVDELVAVTADRAPIPEPTEEPSRALATHGASRDHDLTRRGSR